MSGIIFSIIKRLIREYSDTGFNWDNKKTRQLKTQLRLEENALQSYCVTEPVSALVVG